MEGLLSDFLSTFLSSFPRFSVLPRRKTENPGNEVATVFAMEACVQML